MPVTFQHQLFWKRARTGCAPSSKHQNTVPSMSRRSISFIFSWPVRVILPHGPTSFNYRRFCGTIEPGQPLVLISSWLDLHSGVPFFSSVSYIILFLLLPMDRRSLGLSSLPLLPVVVVVNIVACRCYFFHCPLFLFFHMCHHRADDHRQGDPRK